MKTYKQFIDVLEQVTGATLGFRKTFGAPIGSSTAVTGSVQGGKPTGTQFSASGSLGRGTVSGQGDKINKGISASISNTQSGGGDKEWKGIPYRTPNADTSTSSIRKGAVGSLSANVSGGGVRQKVETPKPVAPKVKPAATKPAPPASARLSKPDPAAADRAASEKLAATQKAQNDAYMTARARLEKGGYADAAGNAYTGSSRYAGNQASDSPNAAVRAQNAQAVKDLKLVGDANRAAREARATGVKRGTVQPDGSVTF